MSPRFWIKLYLEILDDPKMARLPNHLWRRLVELFLLAGRQGNDGALPPVEEMAWTLRLSKDKLLEDLHSLAEIGVVHTCATAAGTGEARGGRNAAGTKPAGQAELWFVTHFKERQTSESLERVRRYRQRYRDDQRNGEETEDSSTSYSVSEGEGVKGEGPALPRSPAEALLHPDVRVYVDVTGGRLPGQPQYRVVIETVRFLRSRRKLDEEGLKAYLLPYWLAWSGRKRLDGRPYDPGNLTWLTEWALNGSIPSQASSATAGAGHAPVPSPGDTLRMLAEKDEKLKQTVPPPEELRAKMRRLAGQLEGKNAP